MDIFKHLLLFFSLLNLLLVPVTDEVRAQNSDPISSEELDEETEKEKEEVEGIKNERSKQAKDLEANVKNFESNYGDLNEEQIFQMLRGYVEKFVEFEKTRIFVLALIVTYVFVSFIISVLQALTPRVVMCHAFKTSLSLKVMLGGFLVHLLADIYALKFLAKGNSKLEKVLKDKLPGINILGDVSGGDGEDHEGIEEEISKLMKKLDEAGRDKGKKPRFRESPHENETQEEFLKRVKEWRAQQGLSDLDTHISDALDNNAEFLEDLKNDLPKGKGWVLSKLDDKIKKLKLARLRILYGFKERNEKLKSHIATLRAIRPTTVSITSNINQIEDQRRRLLEEAKRLHDTYKKLSSELTEKREFINQAPSTADMESALSIRDKIEEYEYKYMPYLEVLAVLNYLLNILKKTEMIRFHGHVVASAFYPTALAMATYESINHNQKVLEEKDAKNPQCSVVGGAHVFMFVRALGRMALAGFISFLYLGKPRGAGDDFSHEDKYQDKDEDQSPSQSSTSSSTSSSTPSPNPKGNQRHRQNLENEANSDNSLWSKLQPQVIDIPDFIAGPFTSEVLSRIPIPEDYAKYGLNKMDGSTIVAGMIPYEYIRIKYLQAMIALLEKIHKDFMKIHQDTGKLLGETLNIADQKYDKAKGKVLEKAPEIEKKDQEMDQGLEQMGFSETPDEAQLDEAALDRYIEQELLNANSTENSQGTQDENTNDLDAPDFDQPQNPSQPSQPNEPEDLPEFHMRMERKSLIHTMAQFIHQSSREYELIASVHAEKAAAPSPNKAILNAQRMCFTDVGVMDKNCSCQEKGNCAKLPTSFLPAALKGNPSFKKSLSLMEGLLGGRKFSEVSAKELNDLDLSPQEFLALHEANLNHLGKSLAKAKESGNMGNPREKDPDKVMKSVIFGQLKSFNQMAKGGKIMEMSKNQFQKSFVDFKSESENFMNKGFSLIKSGEKRDNFANNIGFKDLLKGDLPKNGLLDFHQGQNASSSREEWEKKFDLLGAKKIEKEENRDLLSVEVERTPSQVEEETVNLDDYAVESILQNKDRPIWENISNRYLQKYSKDLLQLE